LLNLAINQTMKATHSSLDRQTHWPLQAHWSWCVARHEQRTAQHSATNTAVCPGRAADRKTVCGDRAELNRVQLLHRRKGNQKSCIFCFGYFPSVRLSLADVSEPSVTSILKGLMKNILHQAFEDGPDRGFRNVGKT
jgi:hypothetical protein